MGARLPDAGRGLVLLHHALQGHQTILRTRRVLGDARASRRRRWVGAVGGFRAEGSHRGVANICRQHARGETGQGYAYGVVLPCGSTGLAARFVDQGRLDGDAARGPSVNEYSGGAKVASRGGQGGGQGGHGGKAGETFLYSGA